MLLGNVRANSSPGSHRVCRQRGCCTWLYLDTSGGNNRQQSWLDLFLWAIERMVFIFTGHNSSWQEVYWLRAVEGMDRSDEIQEFQLKCA